MSKNGLDMSALVCLGINHQTAPVALRERIGQLTASSWKPADQTATEWAVLSTCNRFELYMLLRPDVQPVTVSLQHRLESDGGFVSGELTKHLYTYRGIDAAKHLAMVACGVDSLILGESEIQRQVTDAYISATEQRSIGPALDTVFLAAIRAGKRARAETGISMRPASISSVAISHAEAMVGHLEEHDCLVIGLGEMGRATTRGLLHRGVKRISVTNRTYTRMEAVAPLGVGVRAFEDLDTAIADADVVFTATASRTPIITVELMQRAMRLRSHGAKAQRKLYLIDIAVPRDVATTVGRLPEVCLVDIDHLRIGLDDALEGRRQAVPHVESIIAQEMERLTSTLRQLAARPLVVDLRQQAEEIRAQEVARTLRLMGDIDQATAQHVELMSRALVNKLLHQPTVRLKEAAIQERLPDYEYTVRDLFGLRNGNSSEQESTPVSPEDRNQ